MVFGFVERLHSDPAQCSRRWSRPGVEDRSSEVRHERRDRSPHEIACKPDLVGETFRCVVAVKARSETYGAIHRLWGGIVLGHANDDSITKIEHHVTYVSAILNRRPDVRFGTNRELWVCAHHDGAQLSAHGIEPGDQFRGQHLVPFESAPVALLVRRRF